ncbi:DASH complex subunit Dad1-domain-containing protein [Lophiotrema nucula]|uniref:DASH complex subunit DAD1 n=1 Tax=Lophiotrema nucula TaxID=690887 RepID=A0A6A5ZPK8_9PLEO|nr:DASH complex subunit Dad1-domain-containing protein [Lophiotrema nucula]
MSTNTRASHLNGASSTAAGGGGGAPEQSYFEQQRTLLVGEIAQSLEHVLQNINKLNRSIEEVTGVGNEFAPVEALWSQFENVMAKDQDTEQREGGEGEDAAEEGETEVSEVQK